jgi:EAL domain-containing protein (putative c-di-GMP-specific phosphodiesterase class I)
MLKTALVFEDHFRATPRPWVVAPARDNAFARAERSLWLAYQPIVRCHDRQVIAHEALVRSEEPRLGDPLSLFEAAGRKGRRAQLGRRIRRVVAGELFRVPGDLFVNLAAEDLLDPELFDSSGPLAPFAGRVVLEITEQSPLDGIPNLSGRLTRLRELGFRVAVDDLGAGHSGHMNLAILEPEVVKIDAGLVRQIDRDPERRDVIRQILKLCRKLHAVVVAEGVETEAERDVLVALGVDALQGYLLARPSRDLPATVRW